MNYRLDLHVHTAASPDSRSSLEALTAAAKRRGIDAFAVCDHNRAFYPSSTVDGVLLIPGVEYSTEHGHLLGLFLEAPCHVPGEETGRVPFSEAVQAIHQSGGLCVVAHPFEHTNRTSEELAACLDAHRAVLDGIEGYNCRAVKKRRDANRLAQQAAKRLGLLCTAGSDAHLPGELGRATVTVAAETLTLPALREALAQPVSFSCGKCRHLALAKSQFIRLRRTGAAPKAYLRWCAFAGLCVLRALKGAIS